MIDRQTWESFRAAGLLWWVNRQLHLFGWAIVALLEEDGSISAVYPARCRFRGFSAASEEKGFASLTAHMLSDPARLMADAAMPTPPVTEDHWKAHVQEIDAICAGYGIPAQRGDGSPIYTEDRVRLLIKALSDAHSPVPPEDS